MFKIKWWILGVGFRIKKKQKNIDDKKILKFKNKNLKIVSKSLLNFNKKKFGKENLKIFIKKIQI